MKKLPKGFFNDVPIYMTPYQAITFIEEYSIMNESAQDSEINKMKLAGSVDTLKKVVAKIDLLNDAYDEYVINRKNDPLTEGAKESANALAYIQAWLFDSIEERD